MPIPLSAVLSEINKPSSVFDITYRKVDGSWGSKKSCMIRSNSTNELGERRRMNRSGTLKLLDKASGGQFEIYIDFLQTFNSQPINHLQ